MAKEDQTLAGRYAVEDNHLIITLPTKGEVVLDLQSPDLKKIPLGAMLIQKIRQEQEKLNLDALYGEFFAELGLFKGGLLAVALIRMLLDRDPELGKKVIETAKELIAEEKAKS